MKRTLCALLMVAAGLSGCGGDESRYDAPPPPSEDRSLGPEVSVGHYARARMVLVPDINSSDAVRCVVVTHREGPSVDCEWTLVEEATP